MRRIEALVRLLERIRSETEQPAEFLLEFRTLYRELPREEKPAFFELLISRMEIRKGDIEKDLRLLVEANDKESDQWIRLLSELRRKLESPRTAVFLRFLNMSGGLKFLLDLRADILVAQHQVSANLQFLDQDIAHLFNSWFQGRFLFLQEITQDSAYRQIRFLKDHDLVHPTANLEEMGNRLGGDHRCFALYHRAMPEEPVVFIEAALTHGIARSLPEVIGEENEPQLHKATPDTAIFYSINNAQNGLAGLGLGTVLVFQVVDALKKDNPDITTFATLSPIPGFWKRYLKPILEGQDASFVLKREKLVEYFPEKARKGLLNHLKEVTGSEAPNFPAALLSILPDPKWIEDPLCCGWLKKPLTEVCYFYLAQEKDRQGKPLNSVANFHMSNGAAVSLKNVNFAANRLPRGIEESCGMMVNYVYSKTWLQQIGKTMQSLLPWKV